MPTTTGVIVFATDHDESPSCLYCGAVLSGHADASGDSRPPQAGDFGLCAHCQGLNVFTADSFGRLDVRVPTPQEIALVAGEFAATREKLPALKDELRQIGMIVRYPWERS